MVHVSDCLLNFILLNYMVRMFRCGNEDVSAIKICRDKNADQRTATFECIIFALIFECMQFSVAATLNLEHIQLSCSYIEHSNIRCVRANSKYRYRYFQSWENKLHTFLE